MLTRLLMPAGTFVLATSAFAQLVPESLQAPKDEIIWMQLIGKGKQIYVCQSSAWKLKAPDAKLYAKTGELIARHYAGPTWEHNDGSRVVGKVVASVPSPDSQTIPWLLLTAASHEGKGSFSFVSSIQRLDTKGGIAPTIACTENQETAVPYQATYNFYVKLSNNDPSAH